MDKPVISEKTVKKMLEFFVKTSLPRILEKENTTKQYIGG
jgi:hypothetical protein